MKQLIDITQDNAIVCDNKNCDYTIPNVLKTPNYTIDKYINKPCPDCGDNLLTEEDYNTYIKTMKIIKWVNRWFSWLTVFSYKKNKTKIVEVHFHKGVHIDTEKQK